MLKPVQAFWAISDEKTEKIRILNFIAEKPSIAFFLPGLAYVISGPLTTLLFYRSIKHVKAEVRENGERGSDTM
jgi:hypothetical protein